MGVFHQPLKGNEMSHEIMTDTLGVALALFACGTGRTQSIWHRSITQCTVFDVDTLDPDTIPERLIPNVYTICPIDPETLDPCEGLSIIKAKGFAGRLGQAGGHKRTSWTPAQPREALAALSSLSSVGATLEGVFWLNPGRFYLEGALPSDATLFGRDAHDVRWCAILDFTGAGCDRIIVTLTRVVCANTSRVAVYSAGKAGSIFSIRHSKNIAQRWEIDAPAFLGDYSARVAEHAAKLQTLNTLAATPQGLAGYFEAVLGGPVDADAASKVKTRREWESTALMAAHAEERANAVKVGINPDSMRVAYEAVTNLQNHGRNVTLANGETAWRPLLNGSRSDTGRAVALASGAMTGDALVLALALA